MASGQNDLTEGVIWKKLLQFFFPILLGLLFQQLYNTVDAVVVAKYLGASALAAVGGGAATLTNTVIGFFTGLNSGFTVVISQCYGAREKERLSRTLHTALLFCIAAGAAVMVFGRLLTPWALRMMNTPEDILQESTDYMRIYFIGSIPLLLFNLCQGTMQAVGDSKRPLRYLMCSCLTNIVLDVVFVAVCGWGVKGVAWASALAMMLCVVLALLHMLRTEAVYRVELSHLRLDRSILKKTLRIGVPAGLQGATYNVANVVITTAVNGFGTAAVAAWTACSRLDGVFWATSNAFGAALCAYVGQCYGAGKIGRLRQGLRTNLLLSGVCTVALSTLLLTLGQPALRLLLDEADVIDMAGLMMRNFVPYYIIWTVIENLSSTFRGAGDTFRPMVINILGICVVRILWIMFIVPVWHTIPAVCLVYAASWIVTGIAQVIYYFKGAWLKSDPGAGS